MSSRVSFEICFQLSPDPTNLMMKGNMWPICFCIWWQNRKQPKEWDPYCRQMIFDHSVWIKQTSGLSCKTPCLFGNLEDCIPHGTYRPSDDFQTKFRKVDASNMYSTQYCYTHGCQCPLDKGAHLETKLRGYPAGTTVLQGTGWKKKARPLDPFWHTGNGM